MEFKIKTDKPEKLVAVMKKVKDSCLHSPIEEEMLINLYEELKNQATKEEDVKIIKGRIGDLIHLMCLSTFINYKVIYNSHKECFEIIITTVDGNYLRGYATYSTLPTNGRSKEWIQIYDLLKSIRQEFYDYN